MFTIKENCLEWALKHLLNYSHSDFYPKMFEYNAISHNWEKVKEYLLSLDLSLYRPKSPDINLAPKDNGNFRITHQLCPIDSIIYTALIYDICEKIESFRIPEKKRAVFSYRIKPDMDGSFFTKKSGWVDFTDRTKEHLKNYKNGVVLVTDIADFYNQIYTHRVQNLIEQAGEGELEQQSHVIEDFLLALNKDTSRGIPVGPAPSIILSELIMADIDNKIKTITNDFVRYVDDTRIFFHKKQEARCALHELTKYLYSQHRLIFASDKTRILTIPQFKEKYIIDENEEYKKIFEKKTEQFANEKVEIIFESLPQYYNDYEIDERYYEEYEKVINEISGTEKFKILSDTYNDLFLQALNLKPIDYALIRRILRAAKKYRIRVLVPLILDNFNKVLPVLREIVIYLMHVINADCVKQYKTKFEKLFNNYYLKLPFVNLWLAHLFTNKAFNEVNVPNAFDRIISIRNKALIALRCKDVTWLKEYRDTIDVLGGWDRNAILYSSKILPCDEMRAWVNAVAVSGDIIDKSIAKYVVSEKNRSHLRGHEIN